MDVLFVFTSSLFLLWIIREIFFWLALWQQNGYRQDRLFAYLKSRKLRFLPLFFGFVKWLLFFSFAFVILYDRYLVQYHYVIIGLYIFQSFLLLREVYRNSLKKPDLHMRGLLMFLLTLATVLLLFAFPLLDLFFWLLFVDMLVPFILSFYIVLFLFPIEIYNDWQIEKAGKKIRANPNVFVIAVTGSIGKSATKDYLAQILQHKFIVIKTEGKNNTAIGVSRTILQHLDKHTQVFVAEISAYQRGEIALLCELIRPRVGVLTAINNHYRTLFSSLKNIKETNYELVTSLPNNGFCLFDGNNKNTFSLYQRSKRKKVLYHTLDTSNVIQGKTEIVARNMIRREKTISFDVMLQGQPLHLILHHTHHIGQLLPAIYLASYLGMSRLEIKRAVGKLK